MGRDAVNEFGTQVDRSQDTELRMSRWGLVRVLRRSALSLQENTSNRDQCTPARTGTLQDRLLGGCRHSL